MFFKTWQTVVSFTLHEQLNTARACLARLFARRRPKTSAWFYSDQQRHTLTRHATMTNRKDIQYSMHVLVMTWSRTTPPLGVSGTHTCSPSSEDPHNVRRHVRAKKR